MTIPMVSLELFKELLPKICDKKTSSDPNGWMPENPLWGHCAVVSLVAQNLFGGKIARASLQDTEFENLRSHYWNLLPNGIGEDFTVSQFQRKKLILTVSEISRSYILYDPKTGQPREIMNRYKLLCWRLAKALEPTNLLFDSPIYQVCFDNALDSPCQKMKFGCVIIKNEPRAEMVYEGCNKTIEPLRSLCELTCIRFNIQSRTESMIGACGHAEELGIWNIVKRRINPKKCALYVAGLFSNCLPYIKKEPDFTCLRCAVQLYYAEIGKIYVPVNDKWVGFSAEKAIETARAYAMKEKMV